MCVTDLVIFYYIIHTESRLITVNIIHTVTCFIQIKIF